MAVRAALVSLLLSAVEAAHLRYHIQLLHGRLELVEDDPFGGQGDLFCAVFLLLGVLSGFFTVVSACINQGVTAAYSGLFCLGTLTIGSIYVLLNYPMDRVGQRIGTWNPRQNVCSSLVTATVVMYFCTILLCCGFACMGDKTWMAFELKRDRERKEKQLKGEAVKHIYSNAFEKECNEAFRNADKDGNGKLDLSELHEVVAFRLSDRQRALVERLDLWDRAFNDSNSDQMLCPTQFVEVIRWVEVAAIYAESRDDAQRGNVNPDGSMLLKDPTISASAPAPRISSAESEPEEAGGSFGVRMSQGIEEPRMLQ